MNDAHAAVVMEQSSVESNPLHGGNIPVRLGVGVILRDAGGRILLEKRVDDGRWGLPGGRIEAGESIHDAARREVREETGFDMRITRLIGVYSEPAQRIVTFPDNGDTVHKIDVIVEAAIEGGELACSAESEALEFFEPNGLPDTITAPARAPLEDYRRGLSGVIR